MISGLFLFLGSALRLVGQEESIVSAQIESESTGARALASPLHLKEGRLSQVEALSTPHFLEALFPSTPGIRACVANGRDAIRRVIRGADQDRLIVIVGPCSIHSERGALEYAEKLARLSRRTDSNLVLLMRTYFEKPRTRTGWKGLLNDPDLDGRCDLAKGLRLARQILLEINELGLPCATEFLDPLAAPYLQDLVSWAAIGARTSESQTHRELASDLPHRALGGMGPDVHRDLPVVIRSPTRASSRLPMPRTESRASEH